MAGNRGFTLVELSIVLLIVALLAGAVLAGRTLVRNTELQSAIREYDIYVKAIQEFQTKYQQLPGDYSLAESMWGVDDSGCPNNTYSATPGSNTNTCSGNGNGRIGTSDNVGSLGNETEWWRAWQHLSIAGLIDGKFTGVRGNTGAESAEIRVNVPASGISSGGWTLLYMQQIADSASMYGEATGGYGHLLFLGAPASATYTRAPLLTPADALDIDMKMDNGKPGTGKIRTWRTGYLTNCTANDTSKTNQTYNTAYSGLACSLFFILGF